MYCKNFSCSIFDSITISKQLLTKSRKRHDISYFFYLAAKENPLLQKRNPKVSNLHMGVRHERINFLRVNSEQGIKLSLYICHEEVAFLNGLLYTVQNFFS